MRIATIENKNAMTISEERDGSLVLVSTDGQKLALMPEYPTLFSAVENWAESEPKLKQLSAALDSGDCENTLNVSEVSFKAPLPRTYQWLDGSAFIQHIILVRKARSAEPPETLRTVPLMYQGISDDLQGPKADIPFIDDAYGLDFEGEVGVVLSEVPMGTKASDAGQYIKLIVLMNDVSLRGLIPEELKRGFGFLQGKPATAFAPFAVTPDELGDAWADERVNLEMNCTLNGQPVGKPNGREMFFSFGQLIEHAARTRKLTAGTIIGSGTFSNEDPASGISCLAEKRILEKINDGEIKTPFMKPGDTIEIDMFKDDRSIFGKIDQKVVAFNL